jgi:hypothetical protein
MNTYGIRFTAGSLAHFVSCLARDAGEAETRGYKMLRGMGLNPAEWTPIYVRRITRKLGA